MQIIMFTGDSPDKILAGSKTMTALHWRREPPVICERFRAQRGLRKDTAFAVCEVVWFGHWDGGFCTDGTVDVYPLFGESSPVKLKTSEFARKAGFANWDEFYLPYRTFTNWDDLFRTHWFVEFKVVEVLDSLPF